MFRPLYGHRESNRTFLGVRRAPRGASQSCAKCVTASLWAISIGWLSALLRLHRRPIKVVVFHPPSLPCGRGDLVFGEAWRLDAFSVKSPAPAEDMDRTVSRRSEPSSRTALIGEQPNPWDLLQPQDAMSRHRGAKPLRRYELSTAISLLSPEYLLSVERRHCHELPPDH